MNAMTALPGPIAAISVGTPLGNLFVAILALLVIALVGRVVLALAWRVLLLAALVVGALYALSLLPL